MRNTDIINIKRLCDMLTTVECEIDIDRSKVYIDFYNEDGEIVYSMTFHTETFKDDVAKYLGQVETDIAMLEDVKQKLNIFSLLRLTTEQID